MLAVVRAVLWVEKMVDKWVVVKAEQMAELLDSKLVGSKGLTME